MRAFIVMCLVAVACADKLGYNYQPVGHSSSGLSFAPGSGSIGGGSLGSGSLGGGSLGGGSLGGGSLGGGSLGGGSLGGGLLGSGSLGGGSLGGGSLGAGLGSLGGSIGGGDALSAPVSYSAPAPTGELEKEFFTFSANEQDFDEPQQLEKVSSALNKALRVVFIKGPENRGLENAALALAKQAAQQETAIYVLNKQADIGDLASKLNAIRNNNNNKPEVHFVKYRTPEDAANAQRAIQSQYDQLGGSSQAHDGGVASALNFASAGPIQKANAQIPDNAYLPTSVFRRRL
ncbi:putative mediator of RNA polymerase II transcription subunit 17 [Drosophila ananassae]|uniref:putative mediator of RNA polymerase II transcription subunit 17 n=1 Tax=Drosophila ananassae TaxID=7217 RepID=UPI000177BEF9|nr:putative mediator of RNA polymerase II transcription subunit 17 [Drosophila ananassae]